MKLWRAINKRELAELLAANQLTSQDQLIPGRKYTFFIHINTIWVNSLGKKSWNMSGIARNESDKCGILVSFSRFLLSGFEENPHEPGKYYCRKERIEKIQINFGIPQPVP